MRTLGFAPFVRSRRLLAAVLLLALAVLLEPGSALGQDSAPTVTKVEVTSDAGDDDTYGNGDVIEVTLTFSEAVTVTGTPQISIDMDPAEWGTKQATYQDGSGSTALTFTHTVVEPNISTQGIAVLANSLELNGGTIKSAASDTDAALSHSGLNHDADHKVDWQQAAAEPNCALTAPSSVAALGSEGGVVVTWTLPTGNSGSCVVTGFTVAATSDSLSLVQTVPDPDARSLTIPSITADEYDIAVTVSYAEPEDEPDFDYQTTCGITLTLTADIPYGVTGTWTYGTGTGCGSGAVRIEFKKTADTSWSTYTTPNTEGDLKKFIMGGLEYGVEYQFRVTATHSGGGTTSATGTATPGDGAGGTTSLDGAPRNVRVDRNIFLGLSVWWDAPSSLPAGKTVNGYYVEYKAMDDTAWTRVQTGAPSSLADHRLASTARSLHNSDDGDNLRGVGKLDESKTYRVRVVTEFTDGMAMPTLTEVNSLPSEQVRPVNDYQTWWMNITPNHNTAIGRAFMTIEANLNNASAVCHVNGGEINCPPRTLVSLDTVSSGIYFITTTGNTRHGVREKTAPAIQGMVGNKATASPVDFVRTSGGNGRILLRWDQQVRDNGTKEDDSDVLRWKIQVRSWVNGAWTAWTDWATVDDNEAREAIITGLPNTAHEVAVRKDVAATCDHDGNTNTPNEANEAACGLVAGLWRQYSVTTAADKTAVPGPVTNANLSVSAQDGGKKQLTVSWDAPGSNLLDAYGDEDVYGYKIRHWATGLEEWQEQEFYHRKMWRFCAGNAGTCTGNPRTVTIKDLDAGAAYAVQVAALNVNGVGVWTDLATSTSAPSPQDFVTGATVNQNRLTVNFNGQLSGCPADGGWRVMSGGSVNRVRYSRFSCPSGSSETLYLERPVQRDETVTLSYRKESAANAWWNASVLQVGGVELDSFSNEPVTVAVRPMAFNWAEIAGERLWVSFTEEMDFASLPPASAFTVRATDANGVTRTVGVTDAPFQVATKAWVGMTLAESVEGKTVTVSYAKPSSNPLRSSARSGAYGDAVPSFDNQPVKNGPPRVTSVRIVSDPGDDNTYQPGDQIRIAVTFDEMIQISLAYDHLGEGRTLIGASRIRFNLQDQRVWGDGLRTADYESVSGSTIYYVYTVKPGDCAMRTGDCAPQGIAIPENALELWGHGAIHDGWPYPYDAADLSHAAVARDANHKVQ